MKPFSHTNFDYEKWREDVNMILNNFAGTVYDPHRSRKEQIS